MARVQNECLLYTVLLTFCIRQVFSLAINVRLILSNDSVMSISVQGHLSHSVVYPHPLASGHFVFDFQLKAQGLSIGSQLRAVSSEFV